MLSGALCAHVYGLRESLGVSADSTQRAFPSADVDSFLKRVYPCMPRDSFGGGGGASHVVISVDPAGGGSSQFAVFSLAQASTGSIVVRLGLRLSLRLWGWLGSFPAVRPATSGTAPAPCAAGSPEPGSCF